MESINRNKYLLFFLLCVMIFFLSYNFTSVMVYHDYVIRIKILSILLAVINLFPILFMFYKRRVNFINPLFVFLITFFAFFPLRSIYIIWNDDYAFINMINADKTKIDSYLILLIFALLSFYIGYISKLNFRKKKIKSKITQNVELLSSDSQFIWINRISTVLFFLGLSGFAIFAFTNGSLFIGRGATKLAAGNGYIDLSINLLIPAILLKFISFSRLKKNPIIALLPYLLPALYLYTVLGGRYRLVMLLISLAILIMYYYKLKVGKFSVGLILFGFTYFISIIGANRNSLYVGSSLDLNTGVDKIDKNFLSSTGDLNIFDTFLKIFTSVPEYLNYQYGTTFLSLIVQPIPRSIFPDKPEFASQLIMKTLMPQFYEKGIGFSGSILADFLINFGVYGVIIGMYLTGRIMKKLSTLNCSSITNLLIYSISISVIPFYVRGEFVGTSVWYLVVLLPSLIIYRLSYRIK